MRGITKVKLLGKTYRSGFLFHVHEFYKDVQVILQFE